MHSPALTMIDLERRSAQLGPDSSMGPCLTCQGRLPRPDISCRIESFVFPAEIAPPHAGYGSWRAACCARPCACPRQRPCAAACAARGRARPPAPSLQVCASASSLTACLTALFEEKLRSVWCHGRVVGRCCGHLADGTVRRLSHIVSLPHQMGCQTLSWELTNLRVHSLSSARP